MQYAKWVKGFLRHCYNFASVHCQLLLLVTAHLLTVGLLHAAGAQADCRRVAAVSGEFLPKQKISGG